MDNDVAKLKQSADRYCVYAIGNLIGEQQWPSIDDLVASEGGEVLRPGFERIHNWKV
jgi:hypothetical protein